MSGVEVALALGYISTCQSVHQMLEDIFYLGKLSYKVYDQGGITNLLTNQYNAEVLAIIKSHDAIPQDMNHFIKASSYLMVDFLFLPSLLQDAKFSKWNTLLDINGDTPENWATVYGLMSYEKVDRFEIQLFFRCRDPKYYNIFHFILVLLKGLLLIANSPSFGPTEDVEDDGETKTEYHSSYKSRGSRMYDYLVSKLFEEVENTDSSMHFRQKLNIVRKWFKSKPSKYWKNIFVNAAMLSNSIPTFHAKVNDAVDNLLEIFFPDGFEVNKTNQWILMIKELLRLVNFVPVLEKIKHPEFLFEEIILRVFQQFLTERSTQPELQPQPPLPPPTYTPVPIPPPTYTPVPIPPQVQPARGKGAPGAPVVNPLSQFEVTPEQLQYRSEQRMADLNETELSLPIDAFNPYVSTPDLSDLFVYQTTYKDDTDVSSIRELCLRYPMSKQLGVIFANVQMIFLMFNLSGLNPKERINIEISHFLIQAIEFSSKCAAQAIDIFISPITSLSAIEQQSRTESNNRIDKEKKEYEKIVAKQKIKAPLDEEPVSTPTEPPKDEKSPEFWDSKVSELKTSYEKDVPPKRSWTVKKVSTETTETTTPGKPGVLSWVKKKVGLGGRRTRKRKRVKRTRKTTFS